MGVKELCMFQVAPFFSCQGLQTGIAFWTERDWSQKSCYGNTIEGVILFLFWCTFMVPSFKNTASIFPEISFIQYFTIFSWQQYDVISDLICIIEKTSISLKRKKIFQKEKCHSSVFWKAFQIGRKYFSCHMHFEKRYPFHIPTLEHSAPFLSPCNEVNEQHYESIPEEMLSKPQVLFFQFTALLNT